MKMRRSLKYKKVKGRWLDSIAKSKREKLYQSALGVLLLLGLLILIYQVLIQSSPNLLKMNPNPASTSEAGSTLPSEIRSSSQAVVDADLTASKKPLRLRKQATKVCVTGLNPRSKSLFTTNLLYTHGSHRFTYVLGSEQECLENGNQYNVVLYTRNKVFDGEGGEEAGLKTIENALKTFDIVVLVGDEYCKNVNTKAHFRHYYSHTKMKVNNQLFLPLGPRFEFKRVQEGSVKLMRERRYLFNFIGSITSESRELLEKMLHGDSKASPLASYLQSDRAFVHTVTTWAAQLTKQNGYVTPDEYREIVLDSVFTLCPIGHNPEAFRLYEASEAGSIPIVVMNDEEYNTHNCRDSFHPFISSDAPFIWLNDWSELPAFLLEAEKDLVALQEKQKELRQWYFEFLSRTAETFEKKLVERHKELGKPE